MLDRTVISNTTPLIALAGIGCLDILQKIYGEIIIPQAVHDEIIGEPEKSAVINSSWIKVKRISNVDAKRLYRAKLHAGEVEVMILGEEINADLLLMDDYEAKKTAKFMGFTVTGTLGVLLRAKQEGLITEVKPVMTALMNNGLFISKGVQDYVLKAAGEADNNSEIKE